MSARYVEVAQEDVIWSNLSINPYQARIRYWGSWAMTLGLIIGWSFPGELACRMVIADRLTRLFVHKTT